jgi:hypothetical protein
VLTIFSCPKPFRGHIKTIQTNAIKSWTLLTPRPEVILLGDDEGTAEVCAELGIRHIPEVQRSEYGTPLLNSVFEIGQSAAKHPLVCYVNADIILLSDFVETVRNVSAHFRDQRFLISGRRWNVDVNGFSPDQQNCLNGEFLTYLRSNATLGPYGAMDYFIFTRGVLTLIPPFALGRCGWDNWLLYRARSTGVPLVDGTSRITAVHQAHDYSHTPFNKKGLTSIIMGPEVRFNLQLCTGKSRFYTPLDANYILTDSGIEKPTILRMFHRYALRYKLYTWYVIAEKFYPYSYPLVGLVRSIKLAGSRIKAFFRLPGAA